MSSDFGTAGVTLETRMGTAKQDVESYARAVDGIGGASKDAAEHVDRLEKSTQSLAQAQQAVSDGARNIAEMQKRGLVGTEEYLRAMDKQRVAYQQMMQVRQRATQAVVDADAAAARSAKRASGSPGVGGIAAGVGVGLVAANVAQSAVYASARFVKDSISQASQLQQTLGANTKVFGDYAGEVDHFGSSAARSLGLSRQAAVEAADAFGAVFHAVGVGDDKAVGLSTSLTKLGVDLAAFKHQADPGQALHALEQGLTGQYDALRQYDVVLTTANVRQEAFRLGLIRTRTDALTPQATALAAASLVTQQAAAQTGAFERSTDGLAGKQKVLKANIADAQAELGKGLLPAMSGAADIANGTLIPALSGVGKVIGFIGEHDATRHIAEVATAMYGLSLMVHLAAGAYDKLAGSATVAADAEVEAATAGRAGGLGNLGAAGRAGAGAIGAGPLTVIAAGIVTAVQEVLDRRGLDKTIAQQVAQAKADGPAARTKQAATFGVVPGNQPGQFIVDPNVDADKSSAGVDLLMGLPSAPAPAVAQGLAAARAQAAADRARARQNTAAYNVRDARAYLDSRSYLKDAGSIPLGGLLDALPEKPDPNVVTDAREAYKSSQAAVAIAEARVKQARQTSGGSSPGQIAAAQAAVISARDATQRRGGDPAAEALRLQAAEERLAKAKQGGTTNTLALQTAEKGLADARRSSERAAATLHKAEKDASGDKSISLKDVLARASHTAKTSTSEVGNVRSLVHAGLTEPVIAELEQLEQTAPGTIAKVAKGMTPAYVKQLNADQAARDKATIDLAKLGGQAKLKAAQAEAAKSGKILGDAITAGIVAALKDPAWQALANTELGKLLLPGGTGAPPGGKQPGGVTGGQPSGLGSFGNQLAGLPPGVTAGVTVASAPVVVHVAAAPAPVIVAPRRTTHNNTFPNVKTTAQMRAELDHLELIDSMR